MQHFIKAIPLIILALSTLSWLLIVPKQLATLSNREKMTRLREEAFKLFLMAEKHNWPGKEKMAWAVEKFKAAPMIVLFEEITQENIEDFLQKTYDRFMDQMVEEAHKLDNNETLEENENE